MKVKRENGYSFLEMLLVLSIMSIMTAIIFPMGYKWAQSISEDDALEAFIATVYDLQSYSLAHQVFTRLEFRESGTMYLASARNHFEKRTTLPNGMSLSGSSSLRSIEFHPNGDIINFGTLVFETSTGLKRLRFQFEKGRILVYE